MDRETTVNGRDDHGSPSQALAQSAAGITHDLLTIAELQTRLLVADLRRLAQAALWGLAAWVAAVALLFALVPTALAGAGLLLAAALDQSPGVGLLWVALGATIVLAILIVVGWWQFRRQLESLQRSRQELDKNLALVKRILSNYAHRPQDAAGSSFP